MHHVDRWITDLLLSPLCQPCIIDGGVREGRLSDCCSIERRLSMPYEMQHLQGSSRNSSTCSCTLQVAALEGSRPGASPCAQMWV
jgi:hypothetical protein